MTVVYARIPDELKTALDTYCQERRLKLTAGMVDLMEVGLDAVTNQGTIESLQTRLAEVERREAEARELAAEAENARTAIASQLERQAEAYGLLAGRLNQEIGTCPKCSKPISGYDLVVLSSCPSCQASLSSLLMPKGGQAGALNGPEYLLLVGALGLLVGMSMTQAKKA